MGHQRLRLESAAVAGIDLQRHSPFTGLGDNRFMQINDTMRELRRAVYPVEGKMPDNFDFERVVADNFYDLTSERSTIASQEPSMTDEQRDLVAATKKRTDKEFYETQKSIQRNVERQTARREQKERDDIADNDARNKARETKRSIDAH